MEMKPQDKLAYLLVVIGGLNWGLVGFFNYNLVSRIFSNSVSRVIYAIVGLAALYMFAMMLMMISSQSKKSAK